jgi:hypothetical protein
VINTTGLLCGEWVSGLRKGMHFASGYRLRLVSRAPSAPAKLSEPNPTDTFMSDIQPVTWNQDPAHFRRTSRREFLYVGLIGGLGLNLGNYLKLRADEPAPLTPVAQSLIHIYLPGGSAHQETWDPKPLAPIEYRGPLNSIETSIPGVRLSEHFKNTAKIADKLCIVRSMTHGEAAHERGAHNMFTGYKPSPAVAYPSMGAVVSHELGSRNNLPPYVCIPGITSVAGADVMGTGYLSTANGPFSLGSDPATKGFSVRDLNMHSGLTPERFDRRRNILTTVDEHFRSLEKSDAITSMDSFYQAAYALISSKEAREAFNLSAEPEAIRNEYGMNTAGQRMLMARRLVEGGVRFVSLTYGGWDMHAGIQRGIERELPPFDQAFAALITDLDRRGMLDKTLVMVSSEFGRSPKINKDAGRDHWPRVFSVCFAGGGFKRGLVYGASDPTGAEPDHDPLTVENMAATVFNQLGISPNKKLMAAGNRPVAIVKDGQVMTDLLA